MFDNLQYINKYILKIENREGKMRKQLKILSVVMLLPIFFSGSFEIIMGQPVTHSLFYVSGNNQIGFNGQPLALPFIVSVVDSNGNPVSDFPVNFTVVEGGGTLNDGAESDTILTNQEGLAQAFLTLGSSGTTNQVAATSTQNGQSIYGSPIFFNATFIADQSEGYSLIYVSGNNQMGPPGKPLPLPFVVKVLDVNGNPVENYLVDFTIYFGEGKLNEDYESLTLLTDQEGYAQVVLTLSVKQFSINQVTASAAGLVGSPVIFIAHSLKANPVGNALSLNGNQQYFEIPAAPFINFDTTKDYSVEFWFNQNICEKFNLVNMWYNEKKIGLNEYPGWFVNLNLSNYLPWERPETRPNYLEGKLQCGFLSAHNYYLKESGDGGGGRGRGSSIRQIDIGEWIHFAIIFEKKFIAVYINGNREMESECDGNICPLDMPLNIGGLPPFVDVSIESSLYFNGLIDEVRVWNKALSKGQVESNLVDTLSSEIYTDPNSGLVAYYRFEQMENLGIGDDGLVNDIRDISYNAHHGNIIGGGVTVDPKTSIFELVDTNVPKEFTLLQNYPNPFNSSTTIRYQLPKSTFVTLKVYNTLGQEIGTLVKGLQPEGLHEVIWNANDLPSGIYIYRLETKEFTKTSKMLLQK